MNITFLYRTIARRVILAALISTGILFSTSCREEKQPPTQMQTVMAVHDSVMPKMSEIGRLVAELKPLADSTSEGLVYRKAMEDLQAAHTSMMDWMQGFGERFDYGEIMEGKELSQQKQTWLEEEEVKVKEMAEQVKSSITQARELLESGKEGN
ncbi:MAG: hypothetical protein P8X60_02135 [Robiginitalea sp.]|jgi:hypothetical protein